MVSYFALMLLLLSFSCWISVTSSTTTLYDVLEVSLKASRNEIKTKYRELAKKFHPDKQVNGDNSKFITITNAYEILSDPEKRREYDQTLVESGDARKNTKFRPDYAFKFFHMDRGRYQNGQIDNGHDTVFVFKTANGEFYYRSTLKGDLDSRYFSDNEDDCEYGTCTSARIYTFIFYVAFRIAHISWPYVLVSVIFLALWCFPATFSQPKKKVGPLMRTDLSSYYNSHDHILDEDISQNETSCAIVGDIDVPTATAVRVPDVTELLPTMSSSFLSPVSKTTTSAPSNVVIPPTLCVDGKGIASAEADAAQSKNQTGESIFSGETESPLEFYDDNSILLPLQPALQAAVRHVPEPAISFQLRQRPSDFPKTTQSQVISGSYFCSLRAEHPLDPSDSNDAEIMTINPSLRSVSATNITSYLNYNEHAIISPSKVIEGKKSSQKNLNKKLPPKRLTFDPNIVSPIAMPASPPQMLPSTSSSQKCLNTIPVMMVHQGASIIATNKLYTSSTADSNIFELPVSPTSSRANSTSAIPRNDSSNLMKLRDNLSVLYKKYIVSIVSLNPKVSRILNDIKATFQSDPVVMLDCCEFPVHSHALWSHRQNTEGGFSHTGSLTSDRISVARRNTAPTIYTSSLSNNNSRNANFSEFNSPENKLGNQSRLQNMLNQFGAKLKASPNTAKAFMKNMLRTSSLEMKSSEKVVKPNEPVADEVANKLRSYFRSKNRKNSVDGWSSDDLMLPSVATNIAGKTGLLCDSEDRNSETNEQEDQVESELTESSSSFQSAEDDVAVKLKRYFAKRGSVWADFDSEHSNKESNFNHTGIYISNEGIGGGTSSMAYVSEKNATAGAHRTDLIAIAKNGLKWCGYRYERIVTKPGSLPEDSVSEEEYETNKDLISDWLRKVLRGELEWNDTEVEGRFGSLGYPIKEFHGLTESNQDC